MSNRKILYGYQIQRGELVICPREAEIVDRIVALYMEDVSYQKISDTLNQEHIPFSMETPLWNKHKVKRLLENPRYTGEDGYPSIIEAGAFQAVQRKIRDKTAGYRKKDSASDSSTKMSEEATEFVYVPSGEVIRLTNAINRSLEHLDTPEDVAALILQGISARYDCLYLRQEGEQHGTDDDGETGPGNSGYTTNVIRKDTRER